jgi:hypothetical protein
MVYLALSHHVFGVVLVWGFSVWLGLVLVFLFTICLFLVFVYAVV